MATFDCFIEDFKDWLGTQKQMQFPVAANEFDRLIQEFAIYNEVDDVKSKGRRDLSRHNLGFKDGKLRYFKINFKARGIQDLSHSHAVQVYEYWDQFIQNVNKDLGSNAFQLAGRAWPDLIMRRSFFSNAMQGMVFGLSFSAVVLLLSTKSLYLSFFSLLSIFNVLLTMTIPMYALDWKFGLTESICMIVFIGLSVDYILHISHALAISEEPTRYLKTKQAVGQMTSTILCGAITSMMAGVFLLSCKTYALNKFGVMILVTIISSVINSLVVFPCFVLAIRPREQLSDQKSREGIEL